MRAMQLEPSTASVSALSMRGLSQRSQRRGEDLDAAVHVIKNAPEAELKRALTRTSLIGEALAASDESILLINQQSRSQRVVQRVFALLLCLLFATCIAAGIVYWISQREFAAPASIALATTRRCSLARSSGRRSRASCTTAST